MKEELLFNKKETSSQAWGRAAICGDQVGGLMERKSRKEEHGEIISDKKKLLSAAPYSKVVTMANCTAWLIGPWWLPNTQNTKGGSCQDSWFSSPCISSCNQTRYLTLVCQTCTPLHYGTTWIKNPSPPETLLYNIRSISLTWRIFRELIEKLDNN